MQVYAKEIRDLEIGDIDWLILQRRELYVQTDGFDARFEHLVADILLDFAPNHDPLTECGCTTSKPVRNFGVNLIEQQWEIALQ